MKKIMRYSLTSRFAGGFLGAVVGESVGAWSAFHPPVNLRSLQHEIWAQPGRTQFSLKWSPPLIQGIDVFLEPWSGDLAELARVPSSPSLAGNAIASLPMVCYLHNDPLLLHRYIQTTITDSSTLSGKIDQTTIAVFTEVVAALLRQDDPLQFIIQAIDDSELVHQCPALIYRLTQLYDLLTQRLGLSAAAQLGQEDDLPQLSGTQLMNPETVMFINAFTIALYSFFSSPEQFRLAVVRAAALGYAPALTCTLTGVLSGIHNSMADIPLAWYKLVPHTGKHAELMANPTQHMIGLAEKMAAFWWGAYRGDITTVVASANSPLSRSPIN